MVIIKNKHDANLIDSGCSSMPTAQWYTSAMHITKDETADQQLFAHFQGMQTASQILWNKHSVSKN